MRRRRGRRRRARGGRRRPAAAAAAAAGRPWPLLRAEGRAQGRSDDGRGRHAAAHGGVDAARPAPRPDVARGAPAHTHLPMAAAASAPAAGWSLLPLLLLLLLLPLLLRVLLPREPAGRAGHPGVPRKGERGAAAPHVGASWRDHNTARPRGANERRLRQRLGVRRTRMRVRVRDRSAARRPARPLGGSRLPALRGSKGASVHLRHALGPSQAPCRPSKLRLHSGVHPPQMASTRVKHYPIAVGEGARESAQIRSLKTYECEA
jgi:hypothetical protein